jgi:hypothetical protein
MRPTPADGGGLPDLRDFIRSRRAALAGFMEQGATLGLNGDILNVSPRNDIYVRYMSDNRNVISELASEFYGRRIRAEIMPVDGGGAGAPTAMPASSSAAMPPRDANIEQPATPVVAAIDTGPQRSASHAIAPQTPAEARQALYADPVVRRIFDEFEARLVELRTEPAPQHVSADGPTAEKK